MVRNREHLYLKLSDQLAEQIMDGTLPEGTLLPSERELCQTHGISRTTVRQALQDLSRKGYCRAIHGKGTVVVRPQIRQELRSIYSFDEDMRRLGKQPETQIMDFVEIVPTGTVAARMQLPAGESVYRIMRLRLVKDAPMLLETNYLPCSRFPGFSRQMLENQSLYRVLASEYSLNIDVAEETFEPILLRPMEAQMLHTDQGALGMLVERISYEGGNVVEISKSVSPASKFKHHVVLKR